MWRLIALRRDFPVFEVLTIEIDPGRQFQERFLRVPHVLF